MEILILALVFMHIFAAVTFIPFVAGQKGRSGVGWGCLALLFTPLFALIALAAVPNKLGPIVVTIEPPESEDISEFKWRKDRAP